MADKLLFRTKTAEIEIDYSRCLAVQENSTDPSCKFECVKSCRLYGRNVLKIQNNRPVLAVQDPEEIMRLDNECLACEYGCTIYGANCITIKLPLAGLVEKK